MGITIESTWPAVFPDRGAPKSVGSRRMRVSALGHEHQHELWGYGASQFSYLSVKSALACYRCEATGKNGGWGMGGPCRPQKRSKGEGHAAAVFLS